MLRRALLLAWGLAACSGIALAQSNRIDTVTPSAPELANLNTRSIAAQRLSRKASFWEKAS